MSGMAVSYNVSVMIVEVRGIHVRMGSETFANVIWPTQFYRTLYIDTPILGW